MRIQYKFTSDCSKLLLFSSHTLTHITSVVRWFSEQKLNNIETAHDYYFVHRGYYSAESIIRRLYRYYMYIFLCPFRNAQNAPPACVPSQILSCKNKSARNSSLCGRRLLRLIQYDEYAEKKIGPKRSIFHLVPRATTVLSYY